MAAYTLSVCFQVTEGTQYCIFVYWEQCCKSTALYV